MKTHAEVFTRVQKFPSWQTTITAVVLAALAARGLANVFHDVWSAANDNVADAETQPEYNDHDKGVCDLSPSGYHEQGEPFIHVSFLGEVTLARCVHCHELLFSLWK